MKRRKTQKLLPGGAGRPRQFHIDESTGKMIAQLGLFGHTNAEIAQILGTSEATLARRLREQHAEAETGGGESVLTALKKAREVADAEVVQALFRRATGFRLGKMYYPPDTTAAIFWLKNRQPERWRDVRRTEVSGEVKAPPLLNIVIENDGTPKK